MNLEDLDLAKLSKLTSDFTDELKCLECCKYYIAPSTSTCGHTLCHTCWMGRRTCPECATTFNRKELKLNIPLQTLTQHVQSLGEAFEKLFNVKLDEFNLDTPEEVELERDPDKNVKYWLTSSQNHFSAPIQNTDTFSQESAQPINPLEISASNIIIHPETKKVITPNKLPTVIHVTPPQDDWDKIEQMPDIELNRAKCNENIVGPMDIEPFLMDDIAYTTDKPRRSSRKKDVKQDGPVKKIRAISSKQEISKDLSCETEKKLEKGKQTWNNVKKMRKEFSKLNKTNRNKLNVSTEMVKKAQNVNTITNTPLNIIQQAVNIDENTPNKENESIIAYSNNDPTDNIQEPNSSVKIKNSIKNDAKPCEQQYTSNILVLNENTVVNNKNISKNNYIPESTICSIAPKIVNNTEDSLKPKENPTAKMTFIKKSALCPKNTEIITTETNSSKQDIESGNCEDIEISIKIGKTITNILIKKKTDIQIKVNSDREVQTSLGPYNINQHEAPLKDTTEKNSDFGNNNQELNQNIDVAVNTRIQVTDTKVDKSTSGKKNTASAETATAQFEITESVEKELSNIMECETVKDNIDEPTKINSVIKSQQINTIEHDNVENLDYLNDLDIFNSGSVREGNIQVLKEHAPSEILISTVCSKARTQRNVEKRVRENTKEDILHLPKNKKVKIQQENKQKNTLTDSEPINYDTIMSQVFANIDADIGKTKDTAIIKDTPDMHDTNELNQLENNQPPSEGTKNLTNRSITGTTTKNLQDYFTEKNSENVFSIMEKGDENCDHMQHQVEDLLTPVMCHNLDTSQESHDGVNKANKSNKNLQDCDESDRSVVEETPQKNVSVTKLKRASTANLSLNTSKDNIKMPSNVQSAKTIINLTDTVTECNKTNKDCTVIETAGKKLTLETPLTITKFANHITHKSTPVARKSLNFDYDKDEDNNDPEETLCPTTDMIAKTTQEKEFMTKAFERTPLTPTARPLIARNLSKANRKFCLAASCLTSTEVAKVKVLCAEHKWSYVDKYTKDITHLVVGVDEENKSQRSVKYMCALAASKWIVSFDWINTCLQRKDIADEEYFEALDTFGEPGPRRSRIAKQKLFQGIKFYCMPPFSVLDVDTLKGMLVAAGGLVVNNMKEVAVSEGSTEPALLLAEPEHTQEDRFIYLAMEKNIVPVNYEWVLNCLGGYTLSSIQELLLCPSSLLQAATARWPDVLLSQD